MDEITEVEIFINKQGKRMNKQTTFEIWCEGYSATGEHGTAHLIGTGIGETFDDAVRDYMSKNSKHGIEEDENNKRSRWSIWACRLFDNETDARKSFG